MPRQKNQDRRDKIRALALKYPHATVTDIAKELGCTRTWAAYLLKDLGLTVGPLRDTIEASA